MLLRLFSVALAAVLAFPAYAATFNVSDPTEFQNALTTAQSNGEPDTINVAAGTYNVTGGGTLTYTAAATENASLTITGADSTTVILDGGSQVPILRIDTTAVINDGGVSIEIYNMTFQNGNATGAPANGGALAILTDESQQPPELATLVWIGGSEFYGNRATGDGGAVYVRGHAVEGMYLDDLTFDRYQVDATTFVNNQAGGNGGNAYVAGGLFTTPIFLNNIDFFNGIAGGSGGGLVVEGFDPETPSADEAQSVSLTDITFYNNQSDGATVGEGGGGADISSLATTIDTVGFIDNRASLGGGLRIRPNWSSISMVNSGFTGNVASANGGGMAVEETFFQALTLTNNTIWGNTANNSGGGAYLLFDSSSSIATIYNNIIYNNTAEQGTGDDLFVNNRALNDIGATTELFNNDITDYDIGPVAVVGGATNIDAPPLFVDTNLTLRPEPNPQLQASSPAIDTGDNTAPGAPGFDFEGDARPFDGDAVPGAVIDIGMDEYTGAVMQNADLAVSKTDSPDPVTGGNDLTYTVVVTNNGPGDATSVVLNDTLDGRLTFSSATASQGSCVETSGVVDCQIGQVANGMSVTVTIVVTTFMVDGNTPIDNTAVVSATENDPDTSDNTVTEPTMILPAGPAMADLAITKIDTPDPVISGGPTLTYDITVTNNGPDAATGVTVTDTVPMELPIVDATSTAVDDCIINGLLVSCDIGDLAVNATATVTITVTPAPVADTVDIDNTASVVGNEKDPVGGNNSATATTTVTIPESDMMVTVVATPSSPSIGETITFDITIMNGGPSDNLAIDMAITLPAMGTFQSATIGQGTCAAPVAGVIDCTIGDMLSGESVTGQVVVTAPDEAASLVLSASVSGSVTDPAGANNTDSDAVTVIEAVDLVIQGKAEGSGSIGWLELLFATAAIVFMRTRRQLKLALPCLAIAMLTLLPAGQAAAQGDWYVQIAVGQADLDYSASDLTSDLSSLGWSINNPLVDSSGTAWKALGGFAFNEYVAVEAGYVSLGDVMTQFGASIPPSDIDSLLSDTYSVHPYQGDGWLLAGVFSWPVEPDKYSLYAKAGFFAWESELDVRVIQGGTGSVSGDESGTDAMYGVGFEWKLDQTWSLTVEWERYKLNEWLDVPSIGVKVYF
jgi:uncharacterized repeat protein (TIGR01451 family)